MKGSNALGTIFIVVGGIAVAFFLISMLLQVGNTEAFAQGEHVANLNLNYSLLTQIPDWLQGKLSPDMEGPAFAGWFVEVLTFVAIIGLDRARVAIANGHPFLASVYFWGSIGVIVFNFYTDMANGPVLGSGFFGHLFFALLFGFGVAFAGVIGLVFLEHGFALHKSPGHATASATK